jgi:two-component system, response regulator YesN
MQTEGGFEVAAMETAKYKVVVVDDEPRVRKGLASLIPQLDAEWQVVGEAKNGLEAIELVKQALPDLVITDIRMPQMNGLDLLSALKEYPVQVVILSGYGYFEYAQTAIKFGAFDYLLKPLKPQDIQHLLERVKARRQAAPQADNMPSRALHVTKWWKDWLLNESEEDEGEEAGSVYAERLRGHIPQDAASYRMLAVEIDRYDELILEDQWGDKQLVLFAVRNIIHDMTQREEGAACLFLFANGPQLYYLLTDRTDGHELAERFAREVKRWVKISISVGVSSSAAAYDKLPQLFKQAREALRSKWIYGEGIVSDYEDDVRKGSEPFIYPSGIDEALIRAIRSEDAAHALEELKAFVDAVRGAGIPFLLFRRYCLQLLSSVFRVVYEHKVGDMLQQAVREPGDLFHRDFTAEEYTRFMTELIQRIAQALEWSREQRHNRTLDKAIDFIRKNYDKDISLEDVAVQAQMSSSYFSTFFRQESGETFIEYLTRLRIEKAKALMMNSQLRLYEIAQLVGYQDVKYFSRLFKRAVGVTPAEYRQFFYRKEE